MKKSQADKPASNDGQFAQEDFIQSMLKVSEQSREMAKQFFEKNAIPQKFLKGEDSSAAGNGPLGGAMDPFGILNTFTKAMQDISVDPKAILEAQTQYWQDTMTLWQNATQRMLGMETESVVKPGAGDKRFRDDDWNENPVFDYIKQSYLLTSRYIEGSLAATDGVDDKTQKKINFYTKQYIDAMSPTNFVATNPQVLRETMESKGENLVNGFKNILSDMERGNGKLRVTMTDPKAFEMGKDVATTPGQVIYQNDLMQLIQYDAVGKQVFKRPLLILPPWINKYYILDLRPKNSLIKWLTEQGHTVFIVSWVNPDERHAEKNFEDYMLEGPLAAMKVVEQATGEKEINAMGYCLGGTLLAATLAYMQATKDNRIKSASFLTSLIDFSEPGDLGVFIDEQQIESLEANMSEKGFLEGADMSTTFNMLRSNDLIWSFVIHNYMMGKEPFAFDLLYWNSDSTRMPAKMHSFYLREMYLHNRFKEPGGVELNGVPIDISKIKTPSYFLSTRDDHIAPWQSTFSGAKIVSGSVRFVLSGSGHIAGVVNPPEANKYGYWTNTKKPTTIENADEWLDGAKQHEGSWWPDWQNWVKKYAGTKTKARKTGGSKLEPIEAAPGSYAKLRL